MHRFRYLHPLIFAAVAFIGTTSLQDARNPQTAYAESPLETVVERNALDGSQFVYVVFRALDRDGFCSSRNGSISLHPVLEMPVDFLIESGEGIIIQTSNGSSAPGRFATGVLTYSTLNNAASATPIKAFAPKFDGQEDECQAWVKISQSIPGPLRVLVTLPGDDGNPIAFIANLDRTTTNAVNLSYRWTLMAWTGPEAMPNEALSGSGAAEGGSDVSDAVSAIYAWDAATQSWRAYFPGGASIPGANNLDALESGDSYWFAVKGPGGVSWSVPTLQ